MQFYFDKAVCQNTRRALRYEWLATNGLGDYASSSIVLCNTRKYHGLFVNATPNGRYVLLSALEESLCGEELEFHFSTRQHPHMLVPNGFEFQESFTQAQWPIFRYRIGNTTITRELLFVQNKHQLMLRWTIDGNGILPRLLKLKPLLAFRRFHDLTHANQDIQTQTQSIENGFAITPYPTLPTLHFQTAAQHTFEHNPQWYYTVEYQEEHERGFPYSEDLFMPGSINVDLTGVGTTYLVVGTEPCCEDAAQMWAKEAQRINALTIEERPTLAKQLINAGAQFLVKDPQGYDAIIAGYPWFDAWGRDTLISLPGLTFSAGRTEVGKSILAAMGASIRNGLIPNMFGQGSTASYNSADASLWYAFAVQKYLETADADLSWVREYCYPALEQIVDGFRKGPGSDIYIDEEGLLHAGNDHTQLTWMDATACGRPVTPRHGCAVELNALWFNTLAFLQDLSEKFHTNRPSERALLSAMRKHFVAHFYTEKHGGYLGDCYRNGWLDESLRPNQIFAISLPNPILPESYFYPVLRCVKTNLLTPFGLRTLAPEDPNFKSRYAGDPDTRDRSYHQGTVWPWLLGHYTDALIKATWAVEQEIHELLETIMPLFSQHLLQAGVGSISEIFDAAPPYHPNGCFAQAWSVAECLRLLATARRMAPGVYLNWENKVIEKLRHPTDDTSGRGRIL